MINQQQFQQAAKHYRSGRISLSEFQSRVFAGLETKPHPIERGDPSEILVGILGEMKSTGQPAVVTGVSDDLGEQLSQQITDGEFDTGAKTFVCNNGAEAKTSGGNLAVIAVVDTGANFKTGYLAAVIASEKP